MTYMHDFNMYPYVYEDCRSNEHMTFDLEGQGQSEILFLADNLKTT